jgi:uncharacterized protein (DUF39 family)
MKTYQEINEKIREKKAVVVTAEEMISIVNESGPRKAAQEIDVVTTGTFGPMCSSGAMLSTGHTTPRMKIQKAWLNGVPAYSGIAAVDLYIGATEIPDDDPANEVFPGRFEYGGGHVIEDLVRGKDVVLRATAYGTDCYPKRELETLMNVKDLNDAMLWNPRNAYQNYNVAVNVGSSRPISTYLGVLQPRMANANYCSAGQLSPLLNDPHYRTIGIGTRIFLGGGVGYVSFAGTQHDPGGARTEGGVPTGGAGTLALIGDLKGMSADYLRGVSIAGYGVSLAVGVGVPIPVLDEEIARQTAVSDREIFAPVVDYSHDYWNNSGEPLASVTYEELRSGHIKIVGKKIKTAALSSYVKARQIASTLKNWIETGTFALGEPVENLPGPESGRSTRLLAERKPRLGGCRSTREGGGMK